MNSEKGKIELDEARREARFMIQFFKTLWDEIDTQFQDFQRPEKIQIFSSVLQASIALTQTKDEGMRLEDLLGEAKRRMEKRPKRR